MITPTTSAHMGPMTVAIELPKDSPMAEAHFLSPLAPLIDAMLEEDGVKLYVHHLDHVAYIKDDAGVEYPLIGVEWGATAEEMIEIVRVLMESVPAGDDFYSHAGKRIGYRIVDLGNDIIELRTLS